MKGLGNMKTLGENTVMTQQNTYNLRHLRASLGLKQKTLASEASMSEAGYIDVEKNRVKPRLTTAYAIVNALNAHLKTANRPQVTIYDISWEILGED